VPRIKDWFTRSAIAAFIALVAVGYGWYLAAVSEFELSNNKVQSAEQKARTDLVKDLLGKAISTGNDLVRGLPNPAIFSPSSNRATNLSRSSIGLHSFQGILLLPAKGPIV
jgi:hypothetical protein